MSTGETTGQNTGNLHAGHPESNLGLNLKDFALRIGGQTANYNTGNLSFFMPGFYAWFLCMTRVSLYRQILCSVQKAEEVCVHDFYEGVSLV